MKKKDIRKCSIYSFLNRDCRKKENEGYKEEPMKRENEFFHIFLLSFQKF